MRIRALVSSLAAALCCGCFALDLIDEGLEDMKKHSPGSAQERAEAETVPPPPGSGEAEQSARERLEAWWGRARSLTPAETGDRIVRCELGGSVHFTSRSDCRTRGGRARPLG